MVGEENKSKIQRIRKGKEKGRRKGKEKGRRKGKEKGRRRSIFFILSVAIMISFFIESLANVALQFTPVIFWQFKKSVLNLGWPILYLLLILGIPVFFLFFKLSKMKKMKILTFTIIISRIIAQFYISGEIMLLSVIALFMCLIVYFSNVLSLYGRVDFFTHIQDVLVGIISGIGIYLAVYSVNGSLNLTYASLKIPINLVFFVLLIYFAYHLFDPKHLIEKRSNVEGDQLDEPKEIHQADLRQKNQVDPGESRQVVRGESNQVDPEESNQADPEENGAAIELLTHSQLAKLSHIFILGILTFFVIGWIINPAGLSAYDSHILNWVSHGFLFYSAIITGFAILSHFSVRYTLERLNSKLKTILFISNIFFFLLNTGSIFLIEDDSTSLSTAYLLVLILVGLYTILLDLSYLFRTYSFKNVKKNFVGQLIFPLSFAFAYGILIMVTYSSYATLLISIAILSGILIILFFISEMRNFIGNLPPLSPKKEKKKEYGILLLCVFLINLMSVSYIHQTQSYEDPTSSHPTVMMWNIHNGIGLDFKFDLDRIAEEIKEIDPDILGLNEVDKGLIKTGLIDTGSYLAKKLDMYYYYGPSYYKHYGISLLSKYPFEKTENIALPRSPELNSEPRTLIRAEMSIDGELWSFYVNHLSTKEEDRILQVPFIVDVIEARDDRRTVWMGDFNAQPDEEPYGLINTSGEMNFLDTHQKMKPTPSFTGSLNENAVPSKRIDYIFCSLDLVPSQVNVHCSKASDHCAVITKF